MTIFKAECKNQHAIFESVWVPERRKGMASNSLLLLPHPWEMGSVALLALEEHRPWFRDSGACFAGTICWLLGASRNSWSLQRNWMKDSLQKFPWNAMVHVCAHVYKHSTSFLSTKGPPRVGKQPLSVGGLLGVPCIYLWHLSFHLHHVNSFQTMWSITASSQPGSPSMFLPTLP